MPRSLTPRTPFMTFSISIAFASMTFRSVPNSLMEFSPLTPDMASCTLSWITCEKLKVTPGIFANTTSMSSMSLSFVVISGRHFLRGFRFTRNSALKKLVGSVPSSGRPNCETTRLTSGTRSKIVRTSVANRLACSNEMSTGIVARTQRLPSSRAGMNSPPRNGTAAVASTKRPRAKPITRTL